MNLGPFFFSFKIDAPGFPELSRKSWETIIYSHGLNKGFSSKFPEGYQLQQTPKESQRV